MSNCPVGNCNNQESCSRLAGCLTQLRLHNGREIAISRLPIAKPMSSAIYMGYDVETGEHLVDTRDNLFRVNSMTNGTIRPGDKVSVVLPYKSNGSITN